MSAETPPCWSCGQPPQPHVVAAFSCPSCRARNPYTETPSIEAVLLSGPRPDPEATR